MTATNICYNFVGFRCSPNFTIYLHALALEVIQFRFLDVAETVVRKHSIPGMYSHALSQTRTSRP